MEYFDKKKELDENRIISYSISEGYVPMHTIKELFFDDEGVIKNYRLCRWDDYGFNGWIRDEENVDEVSFEFEKNHPLYIPLLHLINYDEELIIDDDDTYEMNKKYLLFKKEEDKIIMKFINKMNDDYDFEKFRVFIKNIGPDCRSKIDCQYKDTKNRLFYFYKEAYEILTNDYHQETIEEYTIKNNPEIQKEELMKYKKEKELILDVYHKRV